MLTFTIEDGSWSLKLKSNVDIWSWNLKIKFEIEAWTCNWKLKSNVEWIQSFKFKFNLKFEVAVRNRSFMSKLEVELGR